MQHNKDCKCCSGEGHVIPRTVDCGNVTREVKVMQFTSCACNKCVEEGGKKVRRLQKRPVGIIFEDPITNTLEFSLIN